MYYFIKTLQLFQPSIYVIMMSYDRSVLPQFAYILLHDENSRMHETVIVGLYTCCIKLRDTIIWFPSAWTYVCLNTTFYYSYYTKLI